MKYLSNQFRLARKATAKGIPLQDTLAIKFYVQQLMSEEIRNYVDAGSKILEVGCGGSLVPHLLGLSGFECYCVDISDLSLRYTRFLNSEMRSNAYFVQADAFSLPFPDGKFDYVYSVGMIEHFHEIDQLSVVRELMRCSSKYVHLEIPNYHPYSAFAAVRTDDDAPHLPCNLEYICDTLGMGILKYSGRSLFSPRRFVTNNIEHFKFLSSIGCEMIKSRFRKHDIDTMMKLERSVSDEELRMFGFQIYTIAKVG